MRGGKMAGQGSYGCGFIPAIPCNGENSAPDGTFTKLMLEKNAEIEMLMTTHIRRIDPEQKYSVYSNRLCEPNYEKLLQEELNKCTHLFGNIKKEQISQLFKWEKFALLQVPYGGEQIDKVKIPKNRFNEFLISLQNLFKGLLKMHSNKLYHFDINPNNILLMEKDGKYLPRFIDFGLSRTAEEFIKDDEYPIDYPCEWWPYDFRVYSPNLPGKSISLKTIEDMYLKHSSIIQDGPPYMPSGVYFYGGDHVVNTRDYFNTIVNIMRKIENNEEERAKYLEKVDVFSLGSALAKLFYYNTGYVYKYDGSYDEPRVFTMNSMGTMKDVTDSNTIIMVRYFYNLILGMMHHNPDERYDVKTAFKKYQEYLTFIGNQQIIDLHPTNIVPINSSSPIAAALAPFSSNPAKLNAPLSLQTPGVSPIPVQSASRNNTNNFNELSKNITLALGNLSL
jgi:serine/threonine protein kinase